MPVHAIYFHGFASGPSSHKGEILAEVFDEIVDSFQRPDLNGQHFEQLRMNEWLDRARATVEGLPTNDRLILCGSSLGAYTAATVAAELDPKRVAILLLAPALGFNQRWPQIVSGQAALDQWKRSGAAQALIDQIVVSRDSVPRAP